MKTDQRPASDAAIDAAASTSRAANKASRVCRSTLAVNVAPLAVLVSLVLAVTVWQVRGSGIAGLPGALLATALSLVLMFGTLALAAHERRRRAPPRAA